MTLDPAFTPPAAHHPRPSDEELQHAQAQSLALFRTWTTTPYLTVLDTEATGLRGRAFVLDLAAIPLNTGARTPDPLLAFLCAPPKDAEWSDAARTMHAPRLDWLPECGIEAYSAPLIELLNRFPVVTYGAAYDHDRLRFSLSETGCPHDFPDFVCVMEAYAPLAGQWSESRGLWKALRLEDACTREGVDLSNLQLHTAYGDAVATARLIHAVAAHAGTPEQDLPPSAPPH